MAPESSGWAMLPIKTILSAQAIFEGQMIGVAIAADTEQIASEALGLVKVEWEQQPFVLDNEKALDPDAAPALGAPSAQEPSQDLEPRVILRALAQLLVEKGVITRDEFAERLRGCASQERR